MDPGLNKSTQRRGGRAIAVLKVLTSRSNPEDLLAFEDRAGHGRSGLRRFEAEKGDPIQLVCRTELAYSKFQLLLSIE